MKKELNYSRLISFRDVSIFSIKMKSIKTLILMKDTGLMDLLKYHMKDKRSNFLKKKQLTSLKRKDIK